MHRLEYLEFVGRSYNNSAEHQRSSISNRTPRLPWVGRTETHYESTRLVVTDRLIHKHQPSTLSALYAQKEDATVLMKHE